MNNTVIDQLIESALGGESREGPIGETIDAVISEYDAEMKDQKAFDGIETGFGTAGNSTDSGFSDKENAPGSAKRKSLNDQCGRLRNWLSRQ
ncbi:unnamed protein product, partial [Mesorhabditis spiculigera]